MVEHDKLVDRTRAVWIGFGRILLLIIFTTCLLITLASIVPRFHLLASPFTGESFDYLQMLSGFMPLWGIDPRLFATLALINELLWVGIPLAIALVVMIRRPHDLYPQFCAVVLVAFAFSADYLSGALQGSYPFLQHIENSLQAWSLAGFTIFLFTFPSGKFLPKWTWTLAALWSAILLFWVFFPHASGNYLEAELAWEMPVFALFQGTLSFTAGIVAQIYRYFSISTREERQQTKWILFGLLVFFVGWSMRSAAIGSSGFETTLSIALIWIGSTTMLILPITFGVAIMRYRLWDIDLIV
ncbi:MAG: hypothetical protein KAG66_02590, partial [Methylococcales bacterium]|nr:hypothetical protein [Methylococcales bacterium]